MRAVDPPRSLEFEDGFADDAGNSNPGLPASVVRVTLARDDRGGTVMDIICTFPSTEAMEQLIAMGMEDRIRAAVGQIDALLSPAAARCSAAR